jgi:hypothetical protein
VCLRAPFWGCWFEEWSSGLISLRSWEYGLVNICSRSLARYRTFKYHSWIVARLGCSPDYISHQLNCAIRGRHREQRQSVLNFQQQQVSSLPRVATFSGRDTIK